MISLISLTLLLSVLFVLSYFVFTVINFANLYIRIIEMSFPPSKILEENVPAFFLLFLEKFSDVPPSSCREVQKNPFFTNGVRTL